MVARAYEDFCSFLDSTKAYTKIMSFFDPFSPPNLVTTGWPWEAKELNSCYWRSLAKDSSDLLDVYNGLRRSTFLCSLFAVVIAVVQQKLYNNKDSRLLGK